MSNLDRRVHSGDHYCHQLHQSITVRAHGRVHTGRQRHRQRNLRYDVPSTRRCVQFFVERRVVLALIQENLFSNIKSKWNGLLCLSNESA